jgi:beta-phosphoglucomutase-like phosphatase (HAD superfamily)
VILPPPLSGLTREGGDIMTQINNNPDPVQRAEQSRIIVEEEMLACDRVVCRPDLGALLHALHDSRLRISISTKNCELAVNKFLEIASVPSGRFYPLVTRDCLGGLSKPDPKVAAHILEVL